MSHEMLSIGFVAQELGVSGSTVTKWVSEGRLSPAMVTPGGHSRFARDEVDRFKATLTKKPEPPARLAVLESGLQKIRLIVAARPAKLSDELPVDSLTVEEREEIMVCLMTGPDFPLSAWRDRVLRPVNDAYIPETLGSALPRGLVKWAGHKDQLISLAKLAEGLDHEALVRRLLKLDPVAYRRGDPNEELPGGDAIVAEAQNRINANKMAIARGTEVVELAAQSHYAKIVAYVRATGFPSLSAWHAEYQMLTGEDEAVKNLAACLDHRLAGERALLALGGPDSPGLKAVACTSGLQFKALTEAYQDNAARMAADRICLAQTEAEAPEAEAEAE